MLFTFIGAILTTKVRGIVLPNCGCFGMGWHPSADATLVTDSLSIGLALLAFLKGASRASLDGWSAAGEKS